MIENSLSAAAAAVRGGYTIECDVQRSADGEVVIFHDFNLERLTASRGAVAAQSAEVLTSTPLRGTGDRIPTLASFLSQIAGAVPVIVEIKSGFDGDMRLAERAAAIISEAPGPIAIQSFDPAVIAHLRNHPGLATKAVPRGVVAERSYESLDYTHLTAERKRELAEFLHFDGSRPDFLTFRSRDMPCAIPFLGRTALRLPVLAWTIRRPDEVGHARQWADQIIFEGFDPTAS